MSHTPKLGHITTFGGHPVIASAALATLHEVQQNYIIGEILEKEQLFRGYLRHKLIKEIRGKGLMLAFLVDSPQIASTIILKSLEKGLILFGLLYEDRAIRITPPLTINEEEIKEGCSIILTVLDEIVNES